MPPVTSRVSLLSEAFSSDIERRARFREERVAAAELPIGELRQQPVEDHGVRRVVDEIACFQWVILEVEQSQPVDAPVQRRITLDQLITAVPHGAAWPVDVRVMIIHFRKEEFAPVDNGISFYDGKERATFGHHRFRGRGNG